MLTTLFRQFSSDQLYSEANVMEIRKLYSKNVFQYIFNNPEIIKKQLIINTHDTRNKGNKITHLIIVKKSQGKRSFIFLVLNIYNIMPKSVNDL